jgi:NAD(P)H dehydrogenase (quinone)
LPFTILQPAPYMQNLLAGWKNIVEDGVLRVPYSVEAKFSFVDLDDVAEAASIVLTEPNHRNAIYELAGTLPMSHVEAAEIIGRALNRSLRAEREKIIDWERRASAALAGNVHSAQRESYRVENLVRMFEYYDQWGLMGNPNVLQWLLKREPASFESFVQRTLQKPDAIH